jgi:nitrite reductase/ring-hydroxylating ferredoxin subunit
MVNEEGYQEALTLEEMVAHVCFCKLHEICYDKNSGECMRNRNIYAEFMKKKSEERLA